MKTINSFSFQVRPYQHPNYSDTIRAYDGSWIMSAGRWDNLMDAVKNAGIWLETRAEEEPQQYELQMVQVEELELNT